MPLIQTKRKRERMASRFINFRKRNKLTQSELGNLIELTRVEVINIEKARKFPRYSTIDRFNAVVERFRAGRALARQKGFD